MNRWKQWKQRNEEAMLRENLRAGLALFSIVLFSGFWGCSKDLEKPEDRFMIFVNALQTEDSKTALECLTEASRKAIVNENPQGSWILQLAAQTRDFSPKVSKTEWVIRNQKARVYYLDSTGSKNHLTLIRDQERFYIHLKTPAKQVFESLKEIHYGPRTLSN